MAPTTSYFRSVISLSVVFPFLLSSTQRIFVFSLWHGVTLPCARTTLSLPATFIISPPSPLPPYPRRPHPSSTTANFPTSSLQALLSSNFSLQSLASRNHFTADTPPSELILVPYLCALGCSRGSRRKMVVEHHAICRPRRALNYQASRVAVFVVFVFVAKRTVLFSCYCGRIENVT